MSVTFKQTTAGEILSHLEDKYGVKVPNPFRVEFGTPYSPRDEVVGFVSLTASYPDVTDGDRRKLKAAFNLDVPWWQKDSDSDAGGKDIEGKADIMGWEVRVSLKGAFVCTIVGQKPKPPADHAVKEAEKLKALTPDQLAYLVALEIKRLEKPGVAYDVECKPA